MLQTDPNARSRFCPMTMVSGTLPSTCHGSQCMAWTWAQREFQFYEGPTHRGLPDHVGDPALWEVHKEYTREVWGRKAAAYDIEPWTIWRRPHPPGTRQGYCGMAMRPVVSKLNRADNMSGLTDGI